MTNLYHTTGGGKIFGPFWGTLEIYQNELRRAYGSLRGVLICNAPDFKTAYKKLLFREKTWDGKQWIKPLTLVD